MYAYRLYVHVYVYIKPLTPDSVPDNITPPRLK